MENKTMQILEKGKYYFDAIRPEQTVFLLTDSGAQLNIYFNNPTEEEINDINTAPIELGYLKINDIIMVLFKAGSISWVDAPFHPGAMKNALTHLEIPQDGLGLSITITLYNAVNGKLEVIRYISSTNNFVRKFYGDVLEMQTQTFNENMYFQKINQVYMKYTTKDLVKMVPTNQKFKIN